MKGSGVVRESTLARAGGAAASARGGSGLAKARGGPGPASARDGSGLAQARGGAGLATARGGSGPASVRGGPGLASARGLVATALGAAGSWLLEPAEPASGDDVMTAIRPRPVIAVFGLARGCGATVVARALAAELASRDVAGAAAVHSDARAAGLPLATRPAARLAKLLADVPGGDTRAVGRLCLVGEADLAALAETARHLAPVVLDAGSTAVGGTPAALADHVLLVATPAVEPALASVAAECLARLDREPIVVLNRANPAAHGQHDEPTHPAEREPQPIDSRGIEPARTAGPGRTVSQSATAASSLAARPVTPAAEAWSTHAVVRLPDSRMGAQLAAGGREPRGELGRAVEHLADLCGGGS